MSEDDDRRLDRIVMAALFSAIVVGLLAFFFGDLSYGVSAVAALFFGILVMIAEYVRIISAEIAITRRAIVATLKKGQEAGGLG